MPRERLAIERIVRPTSVGIPTGVRRTPDAPRPTILASFNGEMSATELRDQQVRSVGAAFLRARPLVVAPVAATNALALGTSDAPLAQRAALGVAIGTAFVLFCVEAWVLRKNDVTERWLATSLVLTLVALGAGCLLSGGVASPLVPLLLAPIVVGIAAFGRAREAAALVALALALAIVVAALVVPGPFPAIDPDPARWMIASSFGGSALLSLVGVGGLVEAHARTSERLDRMRVATLEEAASRMRATEQVGAKVAHELKNPLAAIRALVQVMGEGAGAKDAKRAEVALGEIDRMDVIVGEYLAFARPLADLVFAPVDLLEIARDVAAVLEARAAERDVTTAVRGESSVVDGDARRLREAVLNLASNALAASPRGARVMIDVAPASIAIADEGPGIAPAIARAAGPVASSTAGGTGLGLAIARGAIAQHRGELVFEAREPHGTVATIRLSNELPT